MSILLFLQDQVVPPFFVKLIRTDVFFSLSQEKREKRRLCRGPADLRSVPGSGLLPSGPWSCRHRTGSQLVASYSPTNSPVVCTPHPETQHSPPGGYQSRD